MRILTLLIHAITATLLYTGILATLSLLHEPIVGRITAIVMGVLVFWSVGSSMLQKHQQSYTEALEEVVKEQTQEIKLLDTLTENQQETIKKLIELKDKENEQQSKRPQS